MFEKEREREHYEINVFLMDDVISKSWGKVSNFTLYSTRPTPIVAYIVTCEVAKDELELLSRPFISLEAMTPILSKKTAA